MSFFWYRVQAPPFPAPYNFAPEMAQAVPQAAQAAQAASHAASAAAASPASSAVNSAMHTAQHAFAHPPQPPHFPPTYPGHPHPYYAEFGRHYRRGYFGRGPRLFPLLVVGGIGAWAYSHAKHNFQDLQNENDALRRAIRESSVAEEVPTVPVVEEKPRRRGWGRRCAEQQQQPMTFFEQQQPRSLAQERMI